MKAKVNENCIGCGACVAITDSKIFDFNDDGLAECITDKIKEEDKEITEEAANGCPTSAIEIIKD
jgi:ferredoxin